MARIHVPVGLRWNDLDAYGHVNNAALLILLEEARAQVFWETEDTGEEGSLRSSAVLSGKPDAPVLSLIARQEVEYLAQIPYLRQPLDVQLWLSKIGGANLEICYEVRSPVGASPEVVYARAESTLVLVDAYTGRPQRIAPHEREALSPYLGEPVAFSRRR